MTVFDKAVLESSHLNSLRAYNIPSFVEGHRVKNSLNKVPTKTN